jgi:hypothetical protein
MRIASSVTVIGLIWMIAVSPIHAQSERDSCLRTCRLGPDCIGAGLKAVSPADAERATAQCNVAEYDCEKACKAKYDKWWEFWKK